MRQHKRRRAELSDSDESDSDYNGNDSDYSPELDTAPRITRSRAVAAALSSSIFVDVGPASTSALPVLPPLPADAPRSDVPSASASPSASSDVEVADSEAAADEEKAQPAAELLFSPDNEYSTLMPIFRQSHVRQYAPSTDVARRSTKQLAALSFREWLDDFLRSPSLRRAACYNDAEYFLLLQACERRDLGEVEPAEEQDDDAVARHLNQTLRCNTYRRVNMRYTAADGSEETGPVLVTFEEQANKTGRRNKLYVRPSSSTTPLLLTGMRRCIPYSQIEATLELCHNGLEGGGAQHLPQRKTFLNALHHFDGIMRRMCVQYVTRCARCKLKHPEDEPTLPPPSLVTAPPVSSERKYERVEMGVISYAHQPHDGYRYVWWAQCQLTRHLTARSMEARTDGAVASCLSSMLSLTGPVTVLACEDSQAEEYGGQVLDVCRQWGMQPPVDSSSQDAHLNGSTENGGLLLRRVMAAWQRQERASEWSTALPRLVYQLNCTTRVTSATTPAPHQRMFPAAPTQPMSGLAGALEHHALTAVVNGEPLLTGEATSVLSAAEQHGAVCSAAAPDVRTVIDSLAMATKAATELTSYLDKVARSVLPTAVARC